MNNKSIGNQRNCKHGIAYRCLWLPVAGFVAFSNCDRAISQSYISDIIALPPQENVTHPNLETFPSIEQNEANFPLSEVSQQPEGLGEIEDDPMAQIPAASQFRDIQPTDWAFQALAELRERYDCLAGYPDGTYRGNRPLSRYEFAAGLNACLSRIEEIIQFGAGERITREDLETLRRLQEEFETELVSLQGRVDSLEARTAQLENHQFSTTTKLSGITVFGVQARNDNRADLNPRDGIPDTEDPRSDPYLTTLSLLFLRTDFDPRSYLKIGLLNSTGANNPTVSNDGLLAYEIPSSGLNVFDLHFHWLAADNFAVLVGTEGVNMFNAFRGPNRFEGAATGSLSLFSQRNPILWIGGYNSAGVAFDWQIAEKVSVQGVYSSLNLGRFGILSRGLFDGVTTAALQVLVTPADPFDIAFHYVNNYSINGSLFTGVGDSALTANGQPLQTHAFGATANWQISPTVTLGAWGGYTTSHIPGQSGSVQTTNYMAYLSLPDLFKEGNLGGIYIGVPPKIVSSNLPIGSNVPDFLNTGVGAAGGQPGTTLQIEAFYRMNITDNISITPGIIQIFNPRHTPNSDSITIGVLRTSFLF
ncbi:iron uptake porin [Lusitaniella coriacea]|nr:iron uptake porin [Lusitaniella coriacea]